MLWLDGKWPREANDSTPGAVRGDCPADSGVPADVIAENPDAYVEPLPCVPVYNFWMLTALLATSPGPISASDLLVPPPISLKWAYEALACLCCAWTFLNL